MKRPDYFVCVDSPNREKLGGDLGFSPTTLKLKNYWEWVVEPITQARWWNAARPADENMAIWGRPQRHAGRHLLQPEDSAVGWIKKQWEDSHARRRACAKASPSH